MRIRRSIRIFGRQRDGHIYVRLRLFMYYRQQEFSVGVKVLPAQWDNVACKVIKHPDADVLNEIIDEAKSALNETLKHYEVVEERVPTEREVKRYFQKIFDGVELVSGQGSVESLIRDFCMEKGRERSWSDTTAQKFRALYHNLIEFDKRVTIDKFDDVYMRELVDWYIKQGYTNPTIAKKIGFLKWFLRWCETKSLYTGGGLKSFQLKLKGQNFEQKTIVYLEKSELDKLESWDFHATPYLDRVRDLFVFSCYSGLRFSDIQALTNSQISDNDISVITQKTDDPLRIELNSHTRRILEKYYGQYGEKALPQITNQRANDYIKEACKRVGIDRKIKIVHYYGSVRREEITEKWKCITFHAGRRTFITTALTLGIPVPVIMKWTGHKDSKMLRPYMEIVDELRKREMSKFDSF